MNTNELIIIGQELYKSQMFNIRNPSEGFVIASICDQEKISYLNFKETYTMIQGNIGKRADAILASFQEQGGKHKIKEKTADKCVIVFDFNGEKYESVCDWADLIKEPFTHTSKMPNGQPVPPNVPIEQRPLKDKYATPYSRRQMLFARCVSDGVRSICPLACKGRYTPEEISDFTETDETPIEQPAAATVAPPPETPAIKPETPKAAAPIVDTVKAEKPQETQATAPMNAATDIDYTICRIPQCEMTGKKWADMETNVLQIALDRLPISDSFTTVDRENIQSILKFRADEKAKQANK